MTGMTLEQFREVMQTMTKKMAESNWTPPKHFSSYFRLYEKLLENRFEARPKLEAYLDDLEARGEIPQNDNYVWIDRLPLTVGKSNVDASMVIDVPGLMLTESKWIAAVPMTMLTINLGKDEKVDFFVKYFFEVTESTEALIQISKMNNVNIIPADLELMRSFDYITIEEERVHIGWRYEEDMDMEQLLEMRGKIFNTFKKVYHEIKYGLGL